MIISPAFAQSGGGGMGGLESLLPLVLIFVVFYFLLIRPQQKKQKQHRAMLEALRRGDRVVTAGGIIGTISGFKEKGKIITLKVDNNTTITLTKSAIAGLAGKVNQDDI